MERHLPVAHYLDHRMKGIRQQDPIEVSLCAQFSNQLQGFFYGLDVPG
jgi:hypothetical protein